MKDGEAMPEEDNEDRGFMHEGPMGKKYNYVKKLEPRYWHSV